MSERIDLLLLLERESAQTEWIENVADVDDVVATLHPRAGSAAG